MRGSQIPAFGNWEYVNELPITQYFECARQAGLIRYSSSSGEFDHSYNNNNNDNSNNSNYISHDSVKPRTVPRSKQGKGGKERRSGGTQHEREGSKKQLAAGKVFDVTVTQSPQAHVAKRHVVKNVVNKKQQQLQYDAGFVANRRVSKAVDEDLYQIPPELLKRKRRLGFISRCLVPPCAV